jgi:hypothetical protein
MSIEGAKRGCATQRRAALARYAANPNHCKFCGAVIPVGSSKVAITKKKKFCNHSCAAKFNNQGASRNPKRYRKCIWCNGDFRGASLHQKYCCPKCYREDPNHPVGKQNTAVCRANRYKQLKHEEREAAKLRAEGYEVFSPTVVCDRVAVKDGKVFFVEFKFTGQSLRPGQERIRELTPENYITQFSDKSEYYTD